MASLNTLRTKFGFVLSAIIAFALIAFIFSLKSDMGFSNNDPLVGEMNGKQITYSEYMQEYEKVKKQSGIDESNEQQLASLANSTWQSLLSKHVLAPGFESAGITISESERMAIINGEIPTQTFSALFTDPSTGIYNVDAVNNFLMQAASTPEAAMFWDNINDQARIERETMKYLGLVKGGTYVNKLEVASGVEAANNSYAGKFVSVPYTNMADSLFTVSSSEMKQFYNDHKALFKKVPTRSISYVAFDVNPTSEDLVAIENNVMEVGNNFAEASDIRAFVRESRHGSVANNYRSAAQLSEEEVAALSEGKQYGPINKNNVWTMSRVVDVKNVPDSLGLRHIVLPASEKNLADSLATLIDGGADFAELALNYSVYDQTAQKGGDVGVLPFSSFTDEFITKLEGANEGDVVRIENSEMIQIINVYRADKASEHYMVATLEYPIAASEATTTNIHGQAGLFSVAGKGSVEAFNSAASDASLTVSTASLANGERSIRGINDSRAIARWAFGAEPGDISEIFKTEEGYVVAMVSAVDDNEYTPMSTVAEGIRTMLLRDKKFEAVKAKLSGSTLEEQAASLDAEVKDFENAKFSSFYVQGMGVEPRVIGAVATTENTGVVSKPIKGNTGIYIYVVDSITEAEEPQTAEAERVKAQAQAEGRAQQASFTAVQQMANIKDLRGQYM